MASNVHVLLLNPNSSTVMTQGMEIAAKKITASLSPSVTFDTYTAPSGPASIDDDGGIQASTEVVLGDAGLLQSLQSGKYDAVLIACFSVHTLVAELGRRVTVPVTGIFEASVMTSLMLLPPSTAQQQQQQQQQQQKRKKWGIVTTGSFWEAHLSSGVAQLGASHDFAGVFSTGLTAGSFHTVTPQDVTARLSQATKRLLESGGETGGKEGEEEDVACVVMGCGGMAGLQDIIRSVAVDVYGQERAAGVYVVDGVQAGILQLQQTVLSQQAFGSVN